MVLRLPDFYGPTAEVSYAKTLFDAIRAGATANLLSPVHPPHEWIYVPDTVPVIGDLLERDEAFGNAFNLGGTVSTTRELVAAIGRAARHAPKTRTIAPPMVDDARALRDALSPVGAVTLDDAKLRTVLGPIRRTSFADGIAATLATIA